MQDTTSVSTDEPMTPADGPFSDAPHGAQSTDEPETLADGLEKVDYHDPGMVGPPGSTFHGSRVVDEAYLRSNEVSTGIMAVHKSNGESPAMEVAAQDKEHLAQHRAVIPPGYKSLPVVDRSQLGHK